MSTSLYSVTALPPARRRGELRLPFGLETSPIAFVLLALALIVAAGAGAAFRPVVGIGVVAAVALALAIVLRPYFGVFLIVGLAPITSGLARGMPVPGVRISELLMSAVPFLLLATVQRSEPLRWTRFDWAALAYVVASVVLGIANLTRRGAPLTGTDLGTMLGPLQFFLAYRATATLCRTPERRRWALRLVLLASIPVSVLAILQALGPQLFRTFVANITGLDYLDVPAGGSFRATGPFPAWHNLGGYELIVILIAAGCLMRPVEGVLSRRLLYVVLGLGALATIQTASIAPIVMTVVCVAALAVALRRFGRFAVTATVVAAAAAVLFAPLAQGRLDQEFSQPVGGARSAYVPESINHRYELWTQREVPILHGRWLMGYGPDQPPEMASFPYSESQYFSFLLHGGMVLLAAYLVLMAAMWGMGREASRDRDPLLRMLGRVTVLVVFALLVLNFIEGYFVGSGTAHLTWLLVAVIAGAQARVTRRVPEPYEERVQHLRVPRPQPGIHVGG
ncbi:MAG: hypothetical protein ACJ77M_09945 [Thermoleophilaceae bacterium]